jgi:hypothetical protein
MTQYQTNVYPKNAANPTVANADASRKSIGVCFSGGGSRALTCAWGQLIGLSSIRQADGKRWIDDVRYISSVSGGTWASVLYTFRPASISDEVFLGPAYTPDRLRYNSNAVGSLNVNTMGTSSLGKIPQNFSNLFDPDPFKNIFADYITINALKGITFEEASKWLWLYVIGKNVLKDFKLFTFKNSLFKPRETPWNYADAKHFSLSEAYANNNIFRGGNAPTPDSFVYARTQPNGQPSVPMLIVNTNVVGKSRIGAKLSEPIQIPVQVSPVAGGIYGENPQVNEVIGGGSVESFGFTSQLVSLATPSKATDEFNRPYTLADIATCSSAFYAALLADRMQTAIDDMMKMDDNQMRQHLGKFQVGGPLLNLGEIRGQLSDLALKSLSMVKQDFVPQYNYWPVSAAGQGARANKNTEFTDGGNLENTGVAGLIAQTQGNLRNILAFVNGSEVLEQKGGQVLSAQQMAPLFGVCFDEKMGYMSYQSGGINPFNHEVDPKGFLQIFDNSLRAFDALRQGLFAASGSGTASNPAFFLQRLKLVDNTLLGIKASSNPITVLWVQLSRVNAWQNQLTDPILKRKIQDGQSAPGPLGNLVEFGEFPYYNTIFKIHQTAAETNTLAQMCAWCVANPASPLSKAIADFFAAAGR